MNLILLFLSIVLVNNVITSQFMGICPFLGVSKKDILNILNDNSK